MTRRCTDAVKDYLARRAPPLAVMWSAAHRLTLGDHLRITEPPALVCEKPPDSQSPLGNISRPGVATMMCERAAINTSRQGYSLYDADKRGTPPEVVQSETSKKDITADAVNLFIEGARTGKLENAAFYAADSTLTAIMAREAIYKGREMTWNELMKG